MNPSQRDALCRELVEALSTPATTGEDPLALVAEALPPLPSVTPEVGQLWRAARAAGHRQALIALTHVSAVIRAVVATEDTWLAASDDVIVPGEASPTRAAIALLPSTDLPVPRAALAACVGTLPTSVIEPLRMLLQRQLTGGFRLRAVESLPGEGATAIRWVIATADGAVAASFCSGSRILDPTDGRIAAREAVRRSVSWMAEDALGEVLERGAAPEREGWPARLARRLRAAVAALGDAVLGEPGAADGGLQGAGALAGIGLVGGVGFGRVPGAGAATRFVGALRHPAPISVTPAVHFTLPLGETRASLRVEVHEDHVDILVIAERSGRPRRGVRVKLAVASDAGVSSSVAVTDKRGLATLRDVGMPADARLDLTLVDADASRIVSVA